MNTDGFYLIDKPVGWTSFDVCAKLRKKLNTKKVGHTGTLDPFATGLLVIATGKCTRMIPFLEKAKKTYRTKILLGKTSETLDPESEVVVVKKSADFSLADIKKILSEKFTGKISQIPPKYSALKFGGKRACDLVREGKTVEMKARETEVFDWKVLNFSAENMELEMELTVAAGFYVRSFARDLGESLAEAGMCGELRRLGVGNIEISDAETVETVTDPIDPKYILDTLEHREIEAGRVQDFIAGRAWPYSGVNGDKYLILVGGRSLGIGEIINGTLQPRVVL